MTIEIVVNAALYVLEVSYRDQPWRDAGAGWYVTTRNGVEVVHSKATREIAIADARARFTANPEAFSKPVDKVIKVFILIRPVGSRPSTFPVPNRFVAEIVARGTGTVLYKSTPRDTANEARAFARKAIASRGYTDTTGAAS